MSSSSSIVFRHCPVCATPLVPRETDERRRPACPAEGCGFVQYDNPTPVVAAIVEHEGDVLLVRNARWPANWFGLVTGFLERGESPEEGVLREVKEELGLDGSIGGFVGHYPFPEMNQLIVAFHVVATGDIVLGEELADVKRLAPEQVKPWGFGTGQAMADWLSSRST